MRIANAKIAIKALCGGEFMQVHIARDGWGFLEFSFRNKVKQEIHRVYLFDILVQGVDIDCAPLLGAVTKAQLSKGKKDSDYNWVIDLEFASGKMSVVCNEFFLHRKRVGGRE